MKISNAASEAIEALNTSTVGADGAAKINNPDTPVAQRRLMAREAAANFSLDRLDGEAKRFVSDIVGGGNLPEHMREDGNRRGAWSFMFENHARAKARYGGGRYSAERRSTEVCLENTMRWLVNSWLPENKFHHEAAKARQMTPKQFVAYFKEAASVTQFPAQLLTLVRQVVPELLARSIFTVFGSVSPVARIPVLTHSYGQNQAPYAVDGADLLVVNESGFAWNYSGGLVRGYPIGTGNASDVNFDLPTSGVTSSTLVVYVNGVVTAVTLGAGAGTGGRDRITFGAAPANGAVIVANFDTGTARGAAGRETDLTISNVTLTEEKLSLKAVWTYEDEQDAMAFNNLSLSAEFLTGMLAKIGIDMDASVLRDALYNATGGNATWDTAGYLADDTNSAATFAYESTINEMFTTMSQNLFKRHGRYCDWVVVGTDVGSRLMNLKQFRAMPMGQDTMGRMSAEATGTQTPIGTFGNYEIYQSNAIPADRALSGWYPSNPFDITYAIGIVNPFYTTGDVTDGQGEFTKRKAVAMRYGKAIPKPTQMSTGELI